MQRMKWDEKKVEHKWEGELEAEDEDEDEAGGGKGDTAVVAARLTYGASQPTFFCAA